MSQVKDVKSSEVDFESLVRLALTEKVSWNKLRLFLDDLTSTFETSKKLNDVLLDELQALHGNKIDNQTQKSNEREPEEQKIDENDSEGDVTILFTKQETIDEEVIFIEDNTLEERSEGLDDFVDKRCSLEINDEEELQLADKILINEDVECTEDAGEIVLLGLNQSKD